MCRRTAPAEGSRAVACARVRTRNQRCCRGGQPRGSAWHGRCPAHQGQSDSEAPRSRGGPEGLGHRWERTSRARHRQGRPADPRAGPGATRGDAPWRRQRAAPARPRPSTPIRPRLRRLAAQCARPLRARRGAGHRARVRVSARQGRRSHHDLRPLRLHPRLGLRLDPDGAGDPPTDRGPLSQRADTGASVSTPPCARCSFGACGCQVRGSRAAPRSDRRHSPTGPPPHRRP